MFGNYTIRELVFDDPLKAYRLHRLGIDYVAYQDYRLAEVCELTHRPEEVVLEHLLNDHSSEYRLGVNVEQLSAIEIVSYLKGAHHRYVKERMPFIESAIRFLSGEYKELKKLSEDFTHFKVEFLEHMEDEESRLFPYVVQLNDLARGNGWENLHRVQSLLKDYNILLFEDNHAPVEDEFHEIKDDVLNAIGRYRLDIQAQVISGELTAMATDLDEHARIEDDILIAKVESLENKVVRLLNKKAGLN